jgi:hypothetical protein
LPGEHDILWRQLKELLLGVVPRTRERISVVIDIKAVEIAAEAVHT